MALYDSRATGEVKPIRDLDLEARYPRLMFSETDRRGSYQAIGDALTARENGQPVVLDTERFLRLFDQLTFAKSHQANVLFGIYVEACGPEPFTEDAEGAYYDVVARDAAGLVSGYDVKNAAFTKARVLLSPLGDEK